MFDPDLYRDREEIEMWKQRDPIATFSARLVEEGIATDDDIASMWDAARDETEQAVVEAEAGPLEPVDELENDVVAPTEATP
jgi:pyruvate dehydrogenase E1 component alpha subunit